MKIAFIGKENRIRSIMAEAVARKLLSDLGLRAEVFSAGVEPGHEVHPLALKVLEEGGYPTRGLRPKSLKEIPYRRVDVLVTLCNEARERCEFILSHKRRENWLIEEPRDNTEAFRKTLRSVEEHLRNLLKLPP